jgi:hypothetical protein
MVQTVATSATPMRRAAAIGAQRDQRAIELGFGTGRGL